MVRVHASRAEVLRLESDSMPQPNARSLFTQQQMGSWWQHWEIKAARKETGHRTSHADGSG